MKEQDHADGMLREFEQLAGSRGTWESHWKEIAERVLPSQSDAFTSGGFVTPGAKKTSQIVDATAQLALNRFGAILDSLLTPRNQTWHRVMASNPYLNKDRSVRLWFEEVNRLLFKHRYAPQSNFASQNQQNYKSLGAFGTGCVYADELHGAPGLRYRAIHLGEIFFVENHQGLVNRAYRKFKLTARQAVTQFGSDKLPEQIVSALVNHPERTFDFVHCVKPREDNYDNSRADYMGMPFASYYLSMEGKKVVNEGGYTTFPYAISRYEQAPGEVYGRSPAMDVLPAIKSLNEQKKTMLKQGHRALDPVLLVHDDGVLDGFSMKNGAINTGGVSADGKLLVHALPTGNIAAGKEMMEEERNLINDAFLVTLFQILVDTPQMTATEVMERTREKGILLAPTIGRQQSEYLGPLIDREIDLLSRQGLLPPMPGLLREAKGDYRLEYDSPLSRAQRAEEASGLMRTVESALAIVNVTQDPAPLDHFDWDVIIPEVSSIHGVPSKWMRSFEQIQAMREGRAKQAEVQQAVEAAPGAAAIMNASTKAQQPKGRG